MRKLQRGHALLLRHRRVHRSTSSAAPLRPPLLPQAVLEHSLAVPLKNASASPIGTIVHEAVIIAIGIQGCALPEKHESGTATTHLQRWVFPEVLMGFQQTVLPILRAQVTDVPQVLVTPFKKPFSFTPEMVTSIPQLLRWTPSWCMPLLRPLRAHCDGVLLLLAPPRMPHELQQLRSRNLASDKTVCSPDTIETQLRMVLRTKLAPGQRQFCTLRAATATPCPCETSLVIHRAWRKLFPKISRHVRAIDLQPPRRPDELPTSAALPLGKLAISAAAIVTI